MNSAAEGTSASDSRSACAGLDPSLGWDEAEHLRGELYTEDQLVAHATELARSHGTPRIALTPGPLRARFAAARQRIDDAYRILATEARHRREPTPAEEWLLDNANVVRDQLREIAEDLPLGYLLELPRLTRGAMRGYPARVWPVHRLPAAHRRARRPAFARQLRAGVPGACSGSRSASCGPCRSCCGSASCWAWARSLPRRRPRKIARAATNGQSACSRGIAPQRRPALACASSNRAVSP